MSRHEPRCFRSGPESVICVSGPETEVVRTVMGPRGRVDQFALCRDGETGEWVYPPLTQPDETADEVLERNAQIRQLMGRCRRREGHRGHVA